MVRVSSPVKLRPWSELTAKMVMGVVPGLVTFDPSRMISEDLSIRYHCTAWDMSAIVARMCGDPLLHPT